jgi:hypothetical protein
MSISKSSYPCLNSKLWMTVLRWPAPLADRFDAFQEARKSSAENA